MIIHQELALVPLLSIAENIFLGNEQAKNGVIDWDETRDGARKLLSMVGLSEDPDTLVTNIGVGKQQWSRSPRALSKQVQLLILDEPTASRSEKDSQALLDLLLEFKQQGITSIIISHKLNEISRIADRVTVIRDGRTIETMDTNQITEDRIITSMVGARWRTVTRRRTPEVGEVILEVRGWNVFHPQHRERQMIRDVKTGVWRSRRHCRPHGIGTHRIRHEPVPDARTGRRSPARSSCMARKSTRPV